MICYCMQTCFSIFTIKDCALNKRYQSLLKTILIVFRDSMAHPQFLGGNYL